MTAQNSKTGKQSEGKSSTNGAPAPFSLSRLHEVSQCVEQRKKERNKALTRQLEVCDLMDLKKT